MKENQIRRFKKEWFHVLYNIEIVPESKLKSTEFRKKCEYLFNRMNAKNNIEVRIMELTKQTKSELRSLK